MKLIMENWKKKIKEGFNSPENEDISSFLHYVTGDAFVEAESPEPVINALSHAIAVWIQVKNGMIDPYGNGYLNIRALYEGITVEEFASALIRETVLWFSGVGYDMSAIEGQENKIIHNGKEIVRKKITKEIEKLSSRLEDL